MRFSQSFLGFLPILAALLPACGSGGETTTTTTGGDTTTAATSTGSGGSGGSGASSSTGSGGAAAALCTEPTPVKCSDEIILGMNLQPTATKAKITSAADGAGWTSNIDATAGGAFTSTPEAYTYGKFTDAGLVKVDISDEDSLTSMAWDIAFRRYVVRINSGDSGPSCVQAARVPGTAKYEEISAVPANLGYHTDDYFTDECDIIPDGTGLPNSPATALSSYWTYPGCVKMSDFVFVVALADGHHVKLVVDDFYLPAIQEQCDTTGMIPMSNTGSANFIVRWSYLP
jgi:heme-binding HmuY-like protein